MSAGFSFRRLFISAQIAALSLVLAACNPATPTDTNDDSASSSRPSRPVTNSSAADVSSDGALSSAPAAMEKRYNDGTYSAVGAYRSPAGDETVNVTLTITDDVITDAVFQGNGVHEITMKMQGKFAAGFKAEVVGKKIGELNLTVVNGSSLTPKGFMNAVEQIKTEAELS